MVRLFTFVVALHTALDLYGQPLIRNSATTNSLPIVSGSNVVGSVQASAVSIESINRIIGFRNYSQFITVTGTINQAIGQITIATNPGARVCIYIPPGIYDETLDLRSKPYVDLIGASRSSTIISNASQLVPTLLTSGSDTLIAHCTFIHKTEIGETKQYAWHSDGATAGGVARSIVIAYDCDVSAMGQNSNSGAGLGLFGNQLIYAFNCRFFSQDGFGCYAHNSSSGAQTEPCRFYFVGCEAHGTNFPGLAYYNLGTGQADTLSLYQCTITHGIVVTNGGGSAETVLWMNPADNNISGGTNIVSGTRWITSHSIPPREWEADGNNLFLSDVNVQGRFWSWGTSSGNRLSAKLVNTNGVVGDSVSLDMSDFGTAASTATIRNTLRAANAASSLEIMTHNGSTLESRLGIDMNGQVTLPTGAWSSNTFSSVNSLAGNFIGLRAVNLHNGVGADSVSIEMSPFSTGATTVQLKNTLMAGNAASRLDITTYNGSTYIPRLIVDEIGNVIVSGIFSATNGLFLPQGTNTAPTAAIIGGTVGSVTNHLIKNVGGGLIDYWSDGATLWSKQLAP